MDMIREMGENIFDALLTVPNAVFHQWFRLEKMIWKGGTKMNKFDQILTVAKSIYKNIITSGE